MRELVDCFVDHNLRKRRFSFIQNGSWGPIAGKKMMEAVEAIPEHEIVGDLFTVKSRMTDGQDAELDKLAQAIVDSIRNPEQPIMADVNHVAPEPTPIVGAVKPRAIPPIVEPIRTQGGVPIAPGMEGKVAQEEVPAHAESEEKTKVIQIWRCTFCGYQAEVPKGTDMDTFVCPVCLKVGPGQFILVREKIVPVK